MATIQERLGLAKNTRVIEATSNHPDPFFRRRIAVYVSREDIAEAKQRDHENCAIACAMRNSSPDTEGACIQSRMVYLARRYPRNGLNEKLRGKMVISKHQLSAEGARLVVAFDKNPKKCPAKPILIRPIAPSHTKAARARARGTGKPHVHGHIQRARRHTFLRSAIAPRTM